MNRLLTIAFGLALSAAGCTCSPKAEKAETIEHPHVVMETSAADLTEFRTLSGDPSPLADTVLRKIAHRQLTLGLANLPPRFEGDIPAATYEIIQILPPRVMSDGFTHTVFVDHQSRQYWVLRTGGFAGVYELYGPGDIRTNE